MLLFTAWSQDVKFLPFKIFVPCHHTGKLDILPQVLEEDLKGFFFYLRGLFLAKNLSDPFELTFHSIQRGSSFCLDKINNIHSPQVLHTHPPHREGLCFALSPDTARFGCWISGSGIAPAGISDLLTKLWRQT